MNESELEAAEREYVATRVVEAEAAGDERALEQALRPRTLAEVIGQERVREQLSLVLEAARGRSRPPDHVLLSGPPGLGKTTLAMIIAAEMQTPLRLTSGPAITHAGDLAAILSGMNEGDVLFVDEIHRMSRPAEEMLYIGDGGLPGQRRDPRHRHRRDPAENAAGVTLVRRHHPGRAAARGRDYRRAPPPRFSNSSRFRFSFFFFFVVLGSVRIAKQRIGAVAILLQLIERGQRIVVLAVIGKLQRLREGIAGAVGARLVPIAVADESGGAEHHQDRNDDQGRAKTVPQLLRLLATHLVIDFTDKTVVGHQSKPLLPRAGAVHEPAF